MHGSPRGAEARRRKYNESVYSIDRRVRRHEVYKDYYSLIQGPWSG